MPRQSKPPKDPNAPKRPSSSYFLFSNKRRPILKEAHKDKKVTELAKLISQEWRALTEEQKKPYNEHAQELKEKYQKTLGEYKQTDNYHSFQRRLAEWKQRQKEEEDSDGPKRRKAKPPKDPNAPKRAQTAYFMWQSERRKALLEEAKESDEGIKVTELAKRMGAEWKKLTPEQKQPYADRAKREKAKYDAALKAYKETDEYKEFQARLDQWKADQRRREQEAAQAARRQKRRRDEESGSEESGSEASGSEASGQSGSEEESESEEESGEESARGGNSRFDDEESEEESSEEESDEE